MALLAGASGELWAAAARQPSEAASVRLGTLAGQCLAELDGVTSRALRANTESTIQRHLYAIEWHGLGYPAVASALLVLGNTGPRGSFVSCAKLRGQKRPALAAVAVACATCAASALSVLEAALALDPDMVIKYLHIMMY